MHQKIRHLPTLGILVYVILYVYAATLYPGGSIINTHSEGYDWFHNYWCDLMFYESLNGAKNLARPYAVLAWIILCASILYILLYLISNLYSQLRIKKALQAFALLAMSFGVLASTKNHDLFVMLSFPFGATAVMSLAYSTLRSSSLFLKIGAILVVLSLTASFVMYFTSLGLYWIGVIQKVALLISFIWIVVFYYHYTD